MAQGVEYFMGRIGIFLEQYGYERAEKESEADWLVTGYPIEEKS